VSQSLENAAIAHLRNGERIIALRKVTECSEGSAVDGWPPRAGFVFTNQRVFGLDIEGEIDESIERTEVEDFFEFPDTSPPYFLLGRRGGGTFAVTAVHDAADFIASIRQHYSDCAG